MSTPTERAAVLRLDTVLDDPGIRIVVCCGSGGVGKTTTAAALALRAADRGRRAVVLTIDPARRLAQALGVDELDDTPRRVSEVRAGDGRDPGSLDAMMLDMKRTFDGLVEAHSTPERAQQIFENGFYQSLSSSFAGTQEYMAMEKLGQLREQGAWDLIVVDTPPSRSALDFLDAPQRLGSFLDGRFIRILTAPARTARGPLRLVTAGVGAVTGAFAKILGAQLLHDLQTLVAALDSMFGGFRERADLTYALLQDPETAFVVVAAPEPDALREASYFVERLAADRMPLAGLVLNRVHDSPLPRLGVERSLAGAERLEEDGGHELAAAALRVHGERLRVTRREQRLAQRFTAAHPGVAVATVPALAEDVHDLPGLRQVGERLGSGGERRSPGGARGMRRPAAG